MMLIAWLWSSQLFGRVLTPWQVKVADAKRLWLCFPVSGFSDPISVEIGAEDCRISACLFERFSSQRCANCLRGGRSCRGLFVLFVREASATAWRGLVVSGSDLSAYC
jgi:hypothetical protein